MSWLDKPVRGILLDITGVLYESGQGVGTVIDGSVEAVKKLKKAGIPVRFVTNETQQTRYGIIDKLHQHGYDMAMEEVFSPAPAAVRVLKKRKLHPHLLVHENILPEFAEVEQSDPNCVVLGDAAHQLSYGNINHAFRMLITMEKPVLITLGKGRFYKDDGELTMDVGCYAVALEYACNISAEVMGKPSPSFFEVAVQDMKLTPEEVIMVGDDIISDIGGAQSCGIRGVLVRTGKYRPSDETHPQVKPDCIADNLLQAIDEILSTQK